MERLNSFCFREILNRFIYDEYGDRLGKLIDVYVSKEKGYLRAIGYKVLRNREEFHYEFNNIFFYKKDRKIIIKVREVQDILPQSYKCLLSKELLNKQIIDINGKKVVRIMDFNIINTGNELRVVGVQSGISALLRKYRIKYFPNFMKKAINYLLKKSTDTIIKWENVESFEFIKDSLSISMSSQKISTMHPADIASILEDLDDNNRKKLFESFEDDLASEILEEIEDANIRGNLIKDLSDSKFISIINYLPNDELADILEKLDDTYKEKILINLENEDIETINNILSYEDDLVGSIMNTEFISFNLNVKFGEIIEVIKEMNPKEEHLYSIYVVDEENVLNGVINIKKILLEEHFLNLRDVMIEKFIYVYDTEPLSLAVDKFLKYDLISIPVINSLNKICGTIFIHDVLTKEFFKI